jgi:hypothetical protein
LVQVAIFLRQLAQKAHGLEMVRIRVAARILPEEEFIKTTGGKSNSSTKNEKRLAVIVRNPYEWQIGTLCLDIARAYKSCYQR